MKVGSAYKEREFVGTVIGKIPSEWEVAPLKDVVDINRESLDPSTELPDREFLYIDIESVEGNTGIISNPKRILGRDAPSRARRVVHYKDVIMSTVRPYLKAFAIVPKEYDNQICSTGFAVLSCRNAILPDYLLEVLFSSVVIEQCTRMMMGGQYPALNETQVSEIRIPLPSSQEQQGIAGILWTVENAIRKTNGIIATTERLKKGLMQQLLTRGIGHKEFKYSEELGSEIPKEWEIVSLGDVTNIRYGLGQPPESDENGVPMIRATNIKRGDIVETGLLRVKRSAIPKSRNAFLRAGDIIVVRSGAYTGDIGRITEKWEGAVAGYDLVLSPLKRLIDSVYLANYLLGPRVQKYFSQLRVRAAQPHLNSGQVSKVLIPLPSLAEQEKIATTFSALDNKLEVERNEKTNLERIKQTLMDLLLTGRIRIKVD